MIVFVKRFYASLGWQGWLSLKWRQIQSLVWPVDPFFGRFCVGGSGITCLRVAQFAAVLPSYGPAPWLIGARALFLSRGDFSHVGEATGDLRRLALGCLLMWPVYIALFGLPMVVHHLPYALVLAPLVALLTWLPEREASFGRVAVGLQAANLAMIWFFGAWLIWSFIYGMA